MNISSLPIDRKIRAVLSNGLLRQLVSEETRRGSWFDLPEPAKREAFDTAQQKAATGRAEKSFATLLIEELDIAIGLKKTNDATELKPEHDPNHDHVRIQKERREVEKAYNEAYESAWDTATDKGLTDDAAHAKAHQAGEAARRAAMQKLHDARSRTEEAATNERKNALLAQVRKLTNEAREHSPAVPEETPVNSEQ